MSGRRNTRRVFSSTAASTVSGGSRLSRAISSMIRGSSREELRTLPRDFLLPSQVTYRLTDDRTISAAAAWRCGFGRCGEESTFAVNAYRAVGIPARQIYTPRWAHCDDNHAWVEVWVDGSWHFLGACEPEETLDLGWYRKVPS